MDIGGAAGAGAVAGVGGATVKNNKLYRQVRATSRAIWLYYLLPCGALYFGLAWLAGVNQIAALFICVGVFFALLMVGNYMWVGAVLRHSTLLTAEVLSCARQREYREQGGAKTLYADYYLATLQITAGDTPLRVEQIFDYRLTQGENIPVYYNQKTGAIVAKKQVDACASSRGNGLMYGVMGFCFLVAGCIVVVPKLGGLWANGEFWKVVFGYFISLVFVLLGGYIVADSRKKLRSRGVNCIRVKGVLTSFQVGDSTDSNGDTITIYYPVYTYQWGDQVCHYTSCTGSNRRQHPGASANLYVNPQTGSIFEEREARQGAHMGYIFAALGALVLGILLFLTIGGKMQF